MMPNPNEKKVSMEEDNATGITLTTQGLLKTRLPAPGKRFFWMQRLKQMVPL